VLIRRFFYLGDVNIWPTRQVWPLRSTLCFEETFF